jgi:hypothetical protein
VVYDHGGVSGWKQSMAGGAMYLKMSVVLCMQEVSDLSFPNYLAAKCRLHVDDPY